jgi:hypothetical protein
MPGEFQITIWSPAKPQNLTTSQLSLGSFVTLNDCVS